MVGYKSHSISCRFKVGLGWFVNAFSSAILFMKRKRLKPTKPRGLVLGSKGSIPKMQRDNSTIEPGGIMEVAMLRFDLAWV